MGAWFVMSAMGFFEMNGGTSSKLRVDLTGPLFDRIKIQLDPRYYPGGEFVIETRNQSKENMYIRSVSLNGKELNEPRISFRDIVKGGKLVYEMEPRKEPI
jgi:putative alpha-1,2-mannosidase